MIRLKLALLLGIVSWLGSGCQSAPTRVYESRDVNVELLKEGAVKRIVINQETVVVDARRSFDYHLAHVPGSVNLHWEEFSEARSDVPGRLKGDKFAAARRLARLGIDPDAKVIVVGYGKEGKGEAGRLAWTLFHYGIQDVQVVSVDFFKNKLTNTQSPPLKSRAIWKPKAESRVEVDKTDFLKVVTSAQDLDHPTHIVDVRSKEEYFSKKNFGGGYSTPDIKAINIDWREFLTREGRPNLKLKNKLTEVGIKPTDRVIVLSDKGVRSAAVTMVMLSMGYKKTANFSGGFSDLLKR